jgi:hypothetical protein
MAAKRTRKTTTKKAPKTQEQIEQDEPEIAAESAEPETPEELAEKIKPSNGHFETLDEALLEAQKSVIGVLKDGRNKHHGFNYTRGESMIKFGRHVFHNFGLSLRTAGNGTDTLPSGQDVLNSQYVLAHPASKMREVIPFSLPIVTHSEKGNPIRTADKAALGAATESLAYVIRDLLAVPRFEKDEDINATVGVESETYKTPQAMPKAEVVVPAKTEVRTASTKLFMDDAKVDSIRKLIDETQSNEAKLIEYYRVDGISLLNELQYNHCKQVLQDKLNVDNTARAFNGTAKVTIKEPAPGSAASGGEQTLSQQQVNLVRSSLTAKKKVEADLLANFAFADLSEVPVSNLNEVMAWIRA